MAFLEERSPKMMAFNLDDLRLIFHLWSYGAMWSIWDWILEVALCFPVLVIIENGAVEKKSGFTLSSDNILLMKTFLK